MSTPVQLFTAIVNALVDGTAPAATLTQVADSFTAMASDIEIQSQFGVARSALTPAQKAAIAYTMIKREIKSKVTQGAGQIAAKSVQATVDTAIANANAII